MASLPDTTTGLDVGAIQRAEITYLRERFGVLAWFGFHTRRWWAVADGRLVEGETPARLGERVLAVRGR